MGTHEDGRFVGAAKRLEAVLDSGDDGLGEPLHVVLVGVHGLSEADEQAHVGIVFHKSRNALPCVVGEQRGDGSVAVLRLYPVAFGKGFRDKDVVELLNDEDSSLVGLFGEEAVHLLVLLEGCVVDLHGEGVIRKLDERREGVPVPEVEGVHAVVHQHVEVFHPTLLVIEPGEVLGGVGVFIDMSAGQDEGLLHADARASQHHLRGILGAAFGQVELALVEESVGDVHRAVDDAAGVIAGDGGEEAFGRDAVSLLGEGRAFGQGECYDAVVGLPGGHEAVYRGVASAFVEDALEALPGILHSGGRALGYDDRHLLGRTCSEDEEGDG